MSDRNHAAHSESVEDFLKAVFTLQTEAEAALDVDATPDQARASTKGLAHALGISPPSVTDMARRMVEAGLIDYRKYYGVRLTAAGREIALRVIRRHRLIELYLVEQLGYALHEVHDEAENLEHAVSDRFIDAIAQKLDFPTHDPHGDPIPTADGYIAWRDLVPLVGLAVGEVAHIRRYMAASDAMLQHIIERGFTLGAAVRLVSLEPFDGPVTARVAGKDRIIGFNVANSILVERSTRTT